MAEHPHRTSSGVMDMPLVADPTAHAPGDLCTACDHPVSLSHGGGVFVLSSTVEPLSDRVTLSFQVVLRDCAIGVVASRSRFPNMPSTLAIDVAFEPDTPAPRNPRLGVRIALTPDTIFSSDDPLNDAAFSEYWTATQARFTAIGMALELEAIAAIPSAGRIAYGPTDMSALYDLDAIVLERLSRGPDDLRFVPVVIVSCLDFTNELLGRSSNPLGQTTRIPAALGVAPSLVIVAAGNCASPDTPTPLDQAPFALEIGGAILAHEIGHYLGLYHLDSDAGRPLAGDPSQALMLSNLATSSNDDNNYFSPRQTTVMSRHPDIQISP